MYTIIRFNSYFLLTLTHILQLSFLTNSEKSIYNRVSQEVEFEGFSGLIRYNRHALTDLLENEITLFVPTNTAFQNYGKPLHSDLAFYHMATGARTLQDLKTVQNISCIRPKFPKLWITNTEDGVFVNNAEIVASRSDYVGKTRSTSAGKDQVLHIIDEVLDPIIRNPKFSHTAFDFIATTEKWHLDSSKSVAAFFHKIKEHQITHLYKMEGSNTYFIPIDYGIDYYKFKMLNKKAIFGHLIPGYVLFTRPTMKGVNYKTMANDNDVYMEVSLEEIDGKLYVKGSTFVGTDQNPKGETIAEIIQPNIPVFNGVIHLISKPIGIFERHLKPFPYLPVLDKLATDPTLTTIYEMGEYTGFNRIFTTHGTSFTYFVINDFAWKQINKKGLGYSIKDVDLLKRHLIISDYPYSMESLLAASSGTNYTHVELKTVGGFLRIVVLEIGGNFYIRWNKTYIKVIRPNYECTDGLIHILAGPIVDLS